MVSYLQISKITYNWRQENDGHTSGENYGQFIVGENGVKRIESSFNDTRSAKVFFEDGSIFITNNVNSIKYESVSNRGD